MGHHGRLPELSSDSKDSGIATSIMESTLRRKSLMPSPIPSHKLEVKADVEPLTEDQVCSVSFMPDTPQSLEQEWSGHRLSELSTGRRRSSHESNSSGLGFSLSRHTPKHQSILEAPNDSMFSFSISDDTVVSEDGE